MLLFLVLLVSLLAAESQAVFYELEDAEYHFEQFIVTFNKKYPSEEEKNYRFNIFKENLKKINDQNAEGHATFGITKFADLTTQEFKMKSTGLKSNIGYYSRCKDGVVSDKVSAPDSLDWRDKGAVTKVKDQEKCRASWAFSVTGNLEGQYFIKHNQLLELSEQQLLDCDTDDFGCSGGFMEQALTWILDFGSMKEEDYPFREFPGPCNFDKDKVAVQVTDCFSYTNKTEDQIKEVLANVGPLAIGIDVTALRDYKGGIVECPADAMDPDYAALLVGYGKEGDKPYWLIKNCWGPDWGEEGYFRLAMYKNSCNMLATIVSGVVA